MAVVVHRPGHHDGRPQGKATEDEGKAIGGHNSHNPKCKEASSLTESYVNVWTGDYHLNCDCCKKPLYKLESETTYW
jgi:hypothetical protein